MLLVFTLKFSSSTNYIWIFTCIFLLSITETNSQQSIATFFNSVNNATEGTIYSNIVVEGTTDDWGSIRFMSDGGDNTINILINVYDENNNYVLTCSHPNSGGCVVFANWRLEYIAYSGVGNSCTDGGKDWLRFDDNTFTTTYNNPDHCVKLAPMPITYQNQPSTKLQNNQTHIIWSVATQINNEKYIIEHSHPESFRDGRNFSPIGEIAGDGNSNVTKHYEYIHTSPSIGINYYRIHPVG